jgi:hypothetical protein
MRMVIFPWDNKRRIFGDRDPFSDKNSFNINTVSDTDYFVRALGFLLEKHNTQMEAAKRLGIESYKFDWKGYSLQDWEEDFKVRSEAIVWNAKQRSLKALQSKLKDLRSEEAKTGDALDKIEKLLT